MFKIQTGYYLELLTPETMELLRSPKDKKKENLSQLKIAELVLIHCNIVNKNFQQDSRFLYTFVSNKLFGQLLDISRKNFILLKIFNSEFLYIEVWFTDLKSKPLQI